MDIIGRFVQECCRFEPSLRVTAKELYKTYTGWCRENGNFPMNSRRFHAEFKKSQCSRVKWHDAKSGLVYEGVATTVTPSGIEVEDVD
jgi:putative DNA primase/helicase